MPMLTFAAGVLLGMVVNSGDNSPSMSFDGNANLLYLAPRAAERIKDPFALQVASSDCQRSPGKTIAEIFRATVNKEDYDKVILQVLRVPGALNTSCTSFWFVFTSNSNLNPLDKLPSP
jgi:hypothetical protein